MSDETATVPTVKTLYYYRMQHGRKVRWKLVLDRSNVLVEEGPADELQSGLPLLVPQGDPREAALIHDLTMRGHTVATRDDVTYIDRVPEFELHVARFFTDSTPCFFPGCNELRMKWQAFVAPHRNDQGECPDCVLGGLMNQFRTDGLDNALAQWLASQPK